MRRLAFVATVAAVAVLAAGVSATTAVAKTKHRVGLSLVGAQIGPTELVYDVHGTSRGALVQLITTSTATGGTSTTTFYDGQGTVVSRGRTRSARRMPAESSPSPEAHAS